MAKRGLGNGLDTMLGVNTTQSRKSKSANQSEKVETKEVIKEVVKEVIKEVPKEMTLKIKDIEIKHILKQALTDKTNDREIYMKGIDHSYYYEGYSLYKTEELRHEN